MGYVLVYAEGNVMKQFAKIGLQYIIQLALKYMLLPDPYE